ncbi:hypothetical protein BKA82DRAFT_4010368 [Pisolithus tinctorius]|nr:hypothetical protein BKA82DRAFT_4016186 [Pisolithus tinctorius]KAI6157034.1 hypothetical protein BKA82DRAFT_4009500 [Pisolithus tinctorius]KAI6158286.1 hypothetical protein BKA82DRAFT_4010368 [Pisolithus tinctorius]
MRQSSILVDYEITSSATHIIYYPLLEDFLAKLDLLEPHRGWTAQFLIPLRRMGVIALDDMDLVTPESLHVFFGLPPIAIMDLFAHMHDMVERIHRAHPLDSRSRVFFNSDHGNGFDPY